MIKPHVLALAFACVVVLPIGRAAATPENDLPPPEKTAGVDLRDPQVIEKGMAMLNSTCGGYCHGTGGRGYKGPPLRNRPDLSPESMLNTVRFGRKRAGKLMPAWEGTLTEEEMWTVIAAVVSLRHVETEAGSRPEGSGH
jgi:mono/diheme cytochrome c family protein